MAGRPPNPYVEDCSSDDDNYGGVETLRTSPGQGQPGANVSMKRSHPSDLGADKTPPPKTVNPNIDQQSDSGYSSHTAATMSSADSAPSATSRSPPTAPATTAAAPVPTPPSPALKKRPPIDDRKSSGSPRKPLQRNGSVSSKTRRPAVATRDEECTDPNCKDCGRGRRPKPSPLDSGLDISYPPFAPDTRSQYSDPAPRTRTSYASPQSPTYNTRPYMAGSAVITPAQTQSRRRSSSAARAPRPTSFHEGQQASGYYMNGMTTGYPSPPQDIPQHGPPPASSAYHAMQYPPMNAYSMIGATPPNSYFHPHQMQISPPYDANQRPVLPTRNTTNNFNTRTRPTSMYGAPLVTQNINTSTKGDLPSARYAKTPSSAREARHQPQYDEDDGSSDEYDSAEEYQRNSRRHDRALMPPPQIVPQRRGSLRQSQTDQVSKSERRMSKSLVIDQSHDRDPRSSRVSHAPSRSTSVSRRPAYSKTQSYDTGQAHVMVEHPRSSRRKSVAYEQEPRQREKMYRSDSVNESGHRRRKTDVDVRQRDANPGKLRDTTNDIEAYLQKTRGSATPFNDQVHKAAKQRASKPASGPSNSGSSHSKGSDKASRLSKVTSTGNGEIRFRFDANAPLNLQFNGDMEGRNIQINPVEGGMADIVIGGVRGNENSYRSERGSVSGRKTIVSERREPRRDAEEHSSVRSRNSGGSRRVRDEERRPLRRKEHIQYNQ